MDIACFLTFNFNLSATIYWALRQLNLDSILGRQRLFIESLKTHPFGKSQKEKRGYYPWENKIFHPSSGNTVVYTNYFPPYLSFTWGDYVDPGKSGQWYGNKRLSWHNYGRSDCAEVYNFTTLVGNEEFKTRIEKSEFFARVAELLSIFEPDYQCKAEVEFI